MHKEFLEKAYTEVNDNIKFSEAKNAALITLNSALIAVGIDKLFDNGIMFYWRVLIASGVISLFIPLVISIFSFRATTDSEKGIVKKIYDYLDEINNIDKDQKKYMFYAYVSKHYKGKSDKYLKDTCGKETKGIFFEQVASQIVDLSRVAYRKFILFNIAITIESTIFAMGGLVGVVMAIIKVVTHLLT